MTRVITFSTNISAGHRRAAEAVASAIVDFMPDSTIAERDAMKLLGRTRQGALKNFYLGVIKHRPEIWNYLYHSKSLSGAMSRVGRFIFTKSLTAFEREIREFSPDAIICTQAIPARIIADLRRRNLCAAPILAVATDYGIHPYWADQSIDAYAVPCDEAAEELIRDGIDPSRVHVTGIPVDKIFENPPSKPAARSLLGIDPASRVVLVMGGGNGLGLNIDQIRAVESCDGVDEVIIIAGSNTALARRLRDTPRGAASRTVLSTVSNIHDYYAAADLLVSKPGGLTMSEATSMGLPVVMVSPLPGQEVRNANFLSRRGAALIANDIGALKSSVASLICDEGRRANLIEISKSIGRPSAARKIAGIALELSMRRLIKHGVA